jgi:hypothetical protein
VTKSSFFHKQASFQAAHEGFNCLTLSKIQLPVYPTNCDLCAGVTHLKKGDRLEVQNLYSNTEIDLSTDATYFGAVLFHPGEISSRNNK